MEFLVHASTSGHFLVACSLEIVAVTTMFINVRVIMATPSTHLLLWAMTIFVRVHEQQVIGIFIGYIFFQMLCSGMARFVRVVAHVASSTIRHGSLRT